MQDFETYRKYAKLLVRWHRERNHSLGGRVRQLDRFGTFSDAQVLAMSFPLALGQEIIAFESGHPSWAALKQAVSSVSNQTTRVRRAALQLRLSGANPVLFVRDVSASLVFYRDRLGFSIEFLHGRPPFYAAVRREQACLHLRFVHQPVYGLGRVAEEALIMALIPVDNLKALFAEYSAEHVTFAQVLTKQAWGGTDFHVEDPDGNRIAFVG